ncbi:hypothetical protein ACKLNR_005770 [Fusarium oxysporum f. sp. zingiberi]
MQAVTLHITAFTIITVPYNSISRKLEVNSLVSLVGGDLERLASSKLARLAPLCGLGGLAWEFPRVWVTCALGRSVSFDCPQTPISQYLRKGDTAYIRINMCRVVSNE